jgi:hypothetical protein
MTAAAKLQTVLQGIAPTLKPPKPGQPFLLYWTELCQEAGIDLFAKAQGGTHAESAQDLTFDECLLVAVHLHLHFEHLILKWEAYQERSQAQ